MVSAKFLRKVGMGSTKGRKKRDRTQGGTFYKNTRRDISSLIRLTSKFLSCPMKDFSCPTDRCVSQNVINLTDKHTILAPGLLNEVTR